MFLHYYSSGEENQKKKIIKRGLRNEERKNYYKNPEKYILKRFYERSFDIFIYKAFLYCRKPVAQTITDKALKDINCSLLVIVSYDNRS